MKKLKKRWTLEDNDTCGGHRWTVVFLVVLVVGVVEEGVTGSPSDFQQQVVGEPDYSLRIQRVLEG